MEPERGRGQRGAVTAEFALMLPAVIALAVLLCCLGRAVVVRIECQDAARTIAHRAAQQMQVDAASATEVASGLDQWADAVAVQLAGTGADATLTAVQRGSSLGATADGADMEGIAVSVSAAIVPDPLHALPAMVEGRAFAWSP